MLSSSDFSFLSRRVDDAIDRALKAERLVGVVVLIARDGTTVHRRAAGFADRETGRPMRDGAIFRLASLTKTIVATAAMILVEQGRLSLDDTVMRWLPDFRPAGPDGGDATITLRQLLTHTSGLTYGLFQGPDGQYRKAGVSDGLAGPSLSIAEELRRLASVPLCWHPGTAWNYSLAMDVVGAVLAAACGQPLPDLVRRLVTGPLGMADTSFGVTDEARLVVPYVPQPGASPFPAKRMDDPDQFIDENGFVTEFSPSRAFDPVAFPSGGAGMQGTTSDFLRLLETLRQGGSPLLSAESVRAMMSNQIGDLRINVEPTPSWGFGFGGAVLLDQAMAGDPRPAGTWKWGGVYGHHWYIDPVNRLSVLSLSNVAMEGMTGRFPAELMSAIYGA